MLSLTYLSSTADPLTTEQLDALVRSARSKNEELGITGMMLHSHGTFIQTIEGPRESVDALFTLIDADSRHHDVFIVRREEIKARRFTAWFMGYREISTDEAASIPGVTDYLRTGEIEDVTSRRHATVASHRVFHERVA